MEKIDLFKTRICCEVINSKTGNSINPELATCIVKNKNGKIFNVCGLHAKYMQNSDF